MARVTDRRLDFADKFVISCGTVTFHCRHPQVLLIRDRGSGQVFLPKGRKNVGESLPQAALRETREETGHAVRLVPVVTGTRATATQVQQSQMLSDEKNMEPFAASQRSTGGVLKLMFWYVAELDPGMQEAQPSLQQPDENLETLWAHINNAGSLLSFEDDRAIYTKAYELSIGRNVARMSLYSHAISGVYT